MVRQPRAEPALDQGKGQRFYTFLCARAGEVSSLQSQVSAQMSGFNAGLDTATCSQNSRLCTTVSNS